MHNASATIYCPNPACQAPNPESHKFCQQCRTLIPRRYLWVLNPNTEPFRPGELLGGRYLVRRSQIVLDTQPGFLPELPEDIAPSIEAYLRLSPFQLHVPQIFGLAIPRRSKGTHLFLLEHAPIYPEGIGEESQSGPQEGTLMPELAEAWKHSTALRQLNWLWQMAQLWQPLATQGVASTLLTPDLLRVEGSLVRLLELNPDRRETPSLSDLGQLWRRWQPKAQAEIADFMGEFCQQMIRGQVRSAEQLVALLDRALVVCGQVQSRRIQMITRTDQGPTRQRNEDACYPPSGSVLNFSPTEGESAISDTQLPLMVVCDGIGGHEGGNVASNLAISQVQAQLQPLTQSSQPLDAGTLISQLENAALAANDVISQRNDNEQRQERQRMGTTLVMAFPYHHELYLTHVGDSRAYRITQTGCHQVTVDDDLATREVRLGYTLYRQALQQPGSGSLVQALGMGASSVLHPTVQRFLVDEDCLFLLCSDGLSDHDRVEESWQAELLPILTGKVDLATASQRLIDLANRQNGHDNVTVGLIYCRVHQRDRGSPAMTQASAPENPLVAANLSDGSFTLERPPSERSTTTQILPQPHRANPILRFLGILSLWALGSLAVYLLLPEVRSWVDSIVGIRPNLPESPETPPKPKPSASVVPTQFTVGALIQINRATTYQAGEPAAIALRPRPGVSPNPAIATNPSSIPVGSVLQVTDRQAIPQQGNWLRLKVCSVPTEADMALRVVQPGEAGWIQEDAIAPFVARDLMLTASELGQCTPTVPSPTGSTTPTTENSSRQPSPRP